MKGIFNKGRVGKLKTRVRFGKTNRISIPCGILEIK
jgi:hypothetical protein